jgi:hypothetical protein
MVEQSPRWEFRYLQAMLLRDRRIELDCFLVEGDPVLFAVTSRLTSRSFPRARRNC